MNFGRPRGRHRRATHHRRTLVATLSASAAVGLSWAPSAPAATVLVAEGTAQPAGAAQTAFSGAFCAQNACRSINNVRHPFGVALGSRQLQDAVDETEGDLIVMGYSLGAATIYDRLRVWEDNPESAPDTDRLKLIVTFGNPENKFGGDDRKNYYAGLPAAQPYPHLDVTMQYDRVADRPTRWGWYSMINLTFARHMDYFDPIDIDDPDNLVYQDADGSTYMLIQADALPMLKWMDWFTTDERMAELEAKYRPLVERDYDRPDYIPQGAGADWGNGDPPPSIVGTAGEKPVESGEVVDAADQNTAAPVAHVADGTEQPDAEPRDPDEGVDSDEVADTEAPVEPADVADDELSAVVEETEDGVDAGDESEPDDETESAEQSEADDQPADSGDDES